MHIACKDADQYVSEATDGGIYQLRSGTCKPKDAATETATFNVKSLNTSPTSGCMHKCGCNFVAM